MTDLRSLDNWKTTSKKIKSKKQKYEAHNKNENEVSQSAV